MDVAQCPASWDGDGTAVEKNPFPADDLKITRPAIYVCNFNPNLTNRHDSHEILQFQLWIVRHFHYT